MVQGKIIGIQNQYLATRIYFFRLAKNFNEGHMEWEFTIHETDSKFYKLKFRNESKMLALWMNVWG